MNSEKDAAAFQSKMVIASSKKLSAVRPGKDDFGARKRSGVINVDGKLIDNDTVVFEELDTKVIEQTNEDSARSKEAQNCNNNEYLTLEQLSDLSG